MAYWLLLFFLSHALLFGSSQASNFQLTNYVTRPPVYTVQTPIWTFIPNCWTPWFDRDDPADTGDWETLFELRQEHPGKICQKPLQIQVQTTGGAPAASTGEVFFKFDTVTGFACRNQDQAPVCNCHDYRVRFMCPFHFCHSFYKSQFIPHETTTPPPTTTPTRTPRITTPPTTTMFHISPYFIKYPFLVKSTSMTVRPPLTRETLTTRPTPQIADFHPQCWTQWFDRDDPAGSGDWETLINLHLQNPGKICTKPLQIQVKTTSGQSVSSTGNVIYKSDTTTGFICRNSDQRKGLCSDYMVRFRCPPDFCKPPPQCWTDWFDRDDPSGTGDYETLPQLRSQYPGQICTKPLQIQVETKGGVPLSATGDVIYKADTVSGFICRNADQKKGRCRDYKVRFMCPLRFCVQSRCWTQWFDRDDPSGTGDWETLASLHISYPEQICAAPLQIQAQTTTGLPAIATGNTFASYDTTVGLICKNAEQKKGTRCHDFQVRFLCPPDFCRPKGCFTEWFDRDDPSGSGDWETLFALRAEYPGHVCNSPLQIQVQTTDGYSVAATGNVLSAADVTTGFVCQNSAQPVGHCHDFKVRFVCPKDFCQQKVCWTKWFDRDDPDGTGDWELLPDLRKLHPNEICDTPLYIDVRTVDSNQPITATGQVLHIYSPTQGFACRNEDQHGCKCKDFKVRFGCPCKCTVDIN